MVRRIAITALALAAGAVLTWLGWHPGSANPAMPVDRTGWIVMAVMLAALPWLLRPWLGPVAGNTTARVVRAGGFVTLYGVLAVTVGVSRFAGRRFDHFQAFDQRNWASDMRSGAVVGGLLVLALIGGYPTAILARPPRPAPLTPPT